MKTFALMMGFLFLAGCGGPMIGDNDGATESSLSERDMLAVSSINGTPTEGGGTAEFTIQAYYQPELDVTISLSSPENQLQFSPESVIINADNWSSVQTVTVTAIDDSDNDDSRGGSVDFSISTGDVAYSRASLASLTTDITDNDTALDEIAGSTYTVIRSGGTCPSGFSSGNIDLDTEDDAAYDNNSLTGTTGDVSIISKGVSIPFCSLDNINSNALSNAITTGFAILRRGGTCPTGMNSGTVRISSEINNPDSRVSEAGDSYVQSPDVYIEVCESTGSLTAATFESSNFILLKNGSCPYSAIEGEIKVDTEDNNNADVYSGSIGDSYVSSQGSSVFLALCNF